MDELDKCRCQNDEGLEVRANLLAKVLSYDIGPMFCSISSQEDNIPIKIWIGMVFIPYSNGQ